MVAFPISKSDLACRLYEQAETSSRDFRVALVERQDYVQSLVTCPEGNIIR